MPMLCADWRSTWACTASAGFMCTERMNPAEAVQAHVDLQSAQSIGMHFGTFQLTTEGIDEPLAALEQARAAQQLSASAFRTLAFGESAYLD